MLQVDQPLCPDCALRVKEEVEASLVELDAECAAYTAALERLAKQDRLPVPQKVRVKQKSLDSQHTLQDLLLPATSYRLTRQLSDLERCPEA